MASESGLAAAGPAMLSLVGRQARRLLPRLRVGDLDDRDPDAIRELLPGLWLAVSAWFRPDVRGLHHIPAEGAALIVGNHTGVWNIPGGAHVLLAIVGFNLGRFATTPARRWQSIARIAVPSMLWIGAAAAISSCHRSSLRTGFLLALIQPFRCQPSTHLVMPSMT